MRKTLYFLLTLGGGAFLVSPLGVLAADISNRCTSPKRVVGNVKLQADCIYYQSFEISRSDTSLDCDGAILDGEHSRAIGVSVNGRGRPIENIKISNCRIVNFRNRGVSITSGVRINEFSSDISENYKIAPRNVVLDGVKVLRSGRGGVYFESYVTDSVLKNSIVKDSGKVGVYLDQGSQRISILNNVIQGNGVNGRREGVAIDSSAYNVIEGNKFLGNAGGGIFLYKNCGENFKTGKSAIRWQSSDHNVIRNNLFSHEPVGVWIASRQSRDLSKWGCGDPALDDKGRFYRDYANFNVVEGNEFCGSRIGVKIEGDNNVVVKNRMGKSVRQHVVEPYKDMLKPDGYKNLGNKVKENEIFSCSR